MSIERTLQVVAWRPWQAFTLRESDVTVVSFVGVMLSGDCFFLKNALI
jgi:hypothetical protein